jgi:hypothetical protein
MATSLVHYKLRSRRDLVRVRQRARQIAGLLGFAPADQTWIAATVFEMAWQTWRVRGRAVLRFQIAGARLQVRVAGSSQGLDQLLPEKASRLAAEDWPWVIDQLDQHTPLNLLEEIYLQNQELLGVLHELRRGRTSANPAA